MILGVTNMLHALFENNDACSSEKRCIRSAMSYIVNTCNMIENICRLDQTKSAIRLAVYGIVNSENATETNKNHLFTIWGPDIPNTLDTNTGIGSIPNLNDHVPSKTPVPNLNDRNTSQHDTELSDGEIVMMGIV